MNKERLLKFIGDTSMTIIDVMEKIDLNANRILFIKDEAEALCGCITDGDIRRWILKAGKLNTSVRNVMNKSPKFLFVEKRTEAQAILYQNMITALPILDSRGHIIDIVLQSDTIDKSEKRKKKNLSNIPVVIMAGGKGTRLYPYTKILPKPLIPIGDTPIIERIINCFVEYDILKYYMTVNYKKGMIKSYFSDLNPPYKIEYIEETKPLGTGGSIKLIKDVLEKPFFVTNCDALIMADYGDIYEYHRKSGNAITMVSALKNILIPYGVIHSGKNGEIQRMEEKPKLSYFINTGMYVINPNTVEKIPKNTLFHMTQLIEAVMKAGDKVGMYPVSEDSFLDMGEFSEMKRMEEKLNLISE